MYDDMELLELEDYEDFEDYEDYEDAEDFESFENYEDFEDYEDHEDFEDFEGDPFLGSILPIARKLLPKAMPFIKRGIQAIGRAMREADPSKQAVKTLPIIATKTVKSLAKQAKAGKPITKKRIQTTLVRQTKKTLSNPRQVAKAVKINRTAAKKAVKKAKAKRVLTKKMIRRSRLLVAR